MFKAAESEVLSIRSSKSMKFMAKERKEQRQNFDGLWKLPEFTM
jgi:hypothetical protein